MADTQFDFIATIKDILRRLKLLEISPIVNLTIPDTGKFILPKYASDPAAPDSTEGQMYLNTSDNKVKAYVNGSWVALH